MKFKNDFKKENQQTLEQIHTLSKTLKKEKEAKRKIFDNLQKLRNEFSYS